MLKNSAFLYGFEPYICHLCISWQGGWGGGGVVGYFLPQSND
jgi:hypothetical protein